MDITTIMNFLTEWWYILVIAIILLIALIVKIFRKIKSKKQVPADDTLLPEMPPLYQSPAMPREPEAVPEFVWEEEKPKKIKDRSFEESTESALDYIKEFTETLEVELKEKAEKMKKENDKISKVIDKINGTMHTMHKYKQNLKEKKGILEYNINAVEGARTALSSDAPARNPTCSVCKSILTPVEGGYWCPVHKMIPFK